MLKLVAQVFLCTALVLVAGIKTEESTDNERRAPRGVVSIIDKIMKQTNLVYTSNLLNIYKKKGGLTQAQKDFEKLVPTPAGIQGASKWGDAGNKRVYLQSMFGKAVITIRNKETKNGDVAIDKIEYF